MLYCLQDKSSKIRNYTEKIIKLIINLIPKETYIKKGNEFKPTIAENLTKIINHLYKLKNINNENLEKKGINIERSSSKNRNNKFFSPIKKMKDIPNLINEKNILIEEKLSKSIERDINTNSFFKSKVKNNKDYTNINEKKTIYSNKECIIKNNVKKIKNICYSFNNTTENLKKKIKN